LIIVHSLTPRISATSRWRRPISKRRFLRCSPSVFEALGNALGIPAFRTIRTNGKKATRACPCGWLRSGQRDCRCDDRVIARYRARISGPLLDRIDLHVNVPAVPWSELDSARPGESSRSVRGRVVAARLVQKRRGAAAGVRVNADIPDGCLDEAVAATPDARRLLGRAVDRLGLSARAARRVLKLARTLADLAGEPKVGPGRVATALEFRGDPEGSGAPQ
jgi:magnesium chelatase family protein